MAKKVSKKRVPKKCVEVCSKDDCDGGSCPIDKKKKKTVSSQSSKTKTVSIPPVPEAPKVSLCSKMLAALFFWK